MLMNVRFINIIVLLDIVVRICRVHSGKGRVFQKVREEFFIDRCIRERNCGTGYQVDPVTQTCVGKRDILTRKSIVNSIRKMWMNANKILTNVGKDFQRMKGQNMVSLSYFRPGYICKNVPGTYR